MKKIVLTGGGTSGHITPNIALLPKLKENNFEVVYIGSVKGIEKDLIEKENIKYYGISSGKLRRYFDLKNFTDPFNVIRGYFEARRVLKQERPDLVFSKGGFVTVPVVLAAKHLKIPVIIHESDVTPGLANKISIPAATYICVNFPETLTYLPKNKGVLTGIPIRQELFEGDIIKAKEKLNFTEDKPVLLVIGGSLGSVFINNILRESMDELGKQFNIIHICGKNNCSKDFKNVSYYKQFEYVREELKDFFAFSDIIISRAGANSIAEILALRKPNILIPLSAKASRGDQILNANSYKKQGFSEVLFEESLSKEEFIKMIKEVYLNKDKYIKNMLNSELRDGLSLIVELINKI